MNNSIVFQPIDIIQTPFTTTQNMQEQPTGAKSNNIGKIRSDNRF